MLLPLSAFCENRAARKSDFPLLQGGDLGCFLVYAVTKWPKSEKQAPETRPT
jgi:hypothetical protein